MTDLVKTQEINEDMKLIIAALKEGPRTVTQLVVATSIPDRRVRMILETLLEDSIIRHKGYYNRSVLWQLDPSYHEKEYTGVLPFHDIKGIRLSAHLIDIVLAGMIKSHELPDQDSVTRGDFAMRAMYPLLGKYLGQLMMHDIDIVAISDIRLELTKALRAIESSYDMLKQILNYDGYWELHELLLIKQAPVIAENTTAIWDTYKLALEYLNEQEPPDETVTDATQYPGFVEHEENETDT